MDLIDIGVAILLVSIIIVRYYVSGLPTILIDIADIGIPIMSAFLVARYTSERWVYSREMQSKHDLILVNDIENWASKINQFSWIGPSYRHGSQGESGIREDKEKFFVIRAHDPRLDYFDRVRRHLAIGRPDILKAWNDLKCNSTALNIRLKDWLNVRMDEAKTLNVHGMTLADYMHEVAYARAKVDSGIDFDKPVTQQISPYDSESTSQPYELAVSDRRLGLFNSMEEANQACIKVSAFVQEHGYSEEIKRLVGEQLRLDEDLQLLRKDLQEVVRHVKLGNRLVGNCSDCPVKSIMYQAREAVGK